MITLNNGRAVCSKEWLSADKAEQAVGRLAENIDNYTKENMQDYWEEMIPLQEEHDRLHVKYTKCLTGFIRKCEQVTGLKVKTK